FRGPGCRWPGRAVPAILRSQSSLKILVISYRDMEHPEAGGAEVIIQEIMGRLAQAGHAITMLTGAFRGGAARARVAGADVHRTGNQFNFNFAAPAYYKRHLKPLGFDVIVEDVNKIPFFMPMHEPDVPVVAVVPHLFGTTVFQQASIPLAGYVYLYERFIPLVYKNCFFSVLSESTRDDLIARGLRPDRLRLIHSGMDHGLYFPDGRKPSARPPWVAYLGRLKKYKGIDLVIQAMPEVVQRVPEAVYKIVGEGDDRPRLEAMTRKLGMQAHVDFTGWISGSTKVDLLRNCRILAYTSPKEGWGLSVIEAGACAVPVVASNSPGLRESVVDGKTGYLVPHGDVPILANRMIRLFSDDHLADRMGAEGIQWAATFNWDETTRKTLELLQESAAERRTEPGSAQVMRAG
ncbi:MAG: glycosyltransferase family 4 protein, partial [Candidatus Eisenbacteria bacterium]|nr:glycosyltransferase family 4 protein [Candidatus Eisenbacteria bacterium]